MYSIIFIYVSLIGNGTSQIQAYMGGHNFSWPRIFN